MTQSSESVLRIVVSTDNHLGVHEKDAVRGKDSFETFDEVLKIAQDMEADMVLLGGDFFHESEPSHNTLVQVEQLLSKYCLNDKTINIRILGDQKQNFAEGRVNFENPKFNVGLPVFSIHGNHDYPHGASALSAMDIPSAAGLINYFGKTEIDQHGNLQISPVLIEKGQTRLALYGLGHIADQRLGRVFRTPGAVKWQVPAVGSEYSPESWFNVLVLHQNRIKRGHNSQAYLEDQHIASLQDLDFVLWGHEHDCIPEPESSAAGDFEILQPGSTVATSLAEGESREKHAFILEILRNEDGEIQHRTMKQRLETVRPFLFDHVVLCEQYGVSSDENESIQEFLKKKIEAMIEKANRTGNNMLPLIRLRVDYSGFQMIRSREVQRFFYGKVANPSDMLLWTKKSKRKGKKDQTKSVPDEAHTCLMDELIVNQLSEELEIFCVESCSELFQSVISSSNKGNTAAFFKNGVEKMKSKLMNEEGTVREEAIKASIKKFIAEEENSRTQIQQSNNEVQFPEDDVRPQRRRNQNVRQREDRSVSLEKEDANDESGKEERGGQSDTTRLVHALRNRRGSYRRQTRRKT